MIRLTDTLPNCVPMTAEMLKIRTARQAYPEDTLLWVQDGTDRMISMLDGNMVIYSPCPADDELKSFVNMIAPMSVFSDADTVDALFGNAEKTALVMRFCGTTAAERLSGDSLKSDEIYELLNTEGLELPPYEYFAPDLCHRLNHGLAECFALRGKCAAVSFHAEGAALVNGIASRQRGFGRTALEQIILKEKGRTVYACCTEKLLGFYRKCGFEFLYKTAYWKR